LIRWTFTRGREHMSCQVEREIAGNGAGRFAVISIPSQRLQRGTVEFFENAAAALRRHAMLASDLRETGWKVVAYTH
jgi:hypothetical protein